MFNYELDKILFYIILVIIGFLIILIGICIIFTQSSIHVILFLMFLFLQLTFLAIILEMDFLGLMFIIIYIGAVCVLMLFHIKLIKTFLLKTTNIYNEHLFSCFFFVFILLPILQIKTFSNLFIDSYEFTNEFVLNMLLDNNILVLKLDYVFWLDLINNISQLKLFGILLYDIYFFYLILSSLILLLALVSSLVLIKLKTKQLKKKIKL